MTQTDIDLFAPARLTRAEVRRYNRTAHASGEHMCATCQHVYPWTLEHFTTTSKKRRDGSAILDSNCRACHNIRHREIENRRYATNAAYAEKCRQAAQDYWGSLSPEAKLAHRKKRLKRERARAQEAQYE